jgi:5-formyltetrahydrofolate cyclo-ligase
MACPPQDQAAAPRYRFLHPVDLAERADIDTDPLKVYTFIWMGKGLSLGAGDGPLYRRVYEAVESLGLARPLADETPLPPEPQLMSRFGVSRGTLRRAIAELERENFLRRKPGRGTFVNPSARLRRVVWGRLRDVARPDSRFDLDFGNFVPDFEGSDRCVARIRATAAYKNARRLFITPDNNLEAFRAQAIRDGKELIVSTYGIRRGFVRIEAGVVPHQDSDLAAALDGLERFGQILSIKEVRTLSAIDAVISGAAAVTTRGVHFGKGHGYLDLEWGILRELGLVTDRTPVIVSVHDCQVVNENVPSAAYDCTVDLIATPTRTVRCAAGKRKPPGILWDRVTVATLEQIPYLAQLEREARVAS